MTNFLKRNYELLEESSNKKIKLDETEIKTKLKKISKELKESENSKNTNQKN